MKKAKLTPAQRRSQARALRRDSGLSYEAIGKIVGVSRQRVEQYINGDDVGHLRRGRPLKECPVGVDTLNKMLAESTRERVCETLECSPYLLKRWEADLEQCA